MTLFKQNIGPAGRIVRGAFGLAALASAFVWRANTIALVLLAGSGLFMMFEAVKGWCVARACGLKTPL